MDAFVLWVFIATIECVMTFNHKKRTLLGGNSLFPLIYKYVSSSSYSVSWFLACNQINQRPKFKSFFIFYRCCADLECCVWGRIGGSGCR